MTAIANDIGVDAIFRRQVIAHGRAGDVLLAFSTSGGSRNVIEALAQARAPRHGDGRHGRLRRRARSRREGLADHVIVTRSQHIPRIQEAQASAWHVLRELRVEPAGPARDVRAIDCRTTARTSRARPRRAACVQGVGFRPFVHRLAREHDAGWLGAQRRAGRAARGGGRRGGGASASCAASGRRRAAAGAWSSGWRAERLRADRRGRAFAILQSAARGEPATRWSQPDVAPCEDCLRELLDPNDRRYRYPFINCTNCGPRFTIVRGVPYDRRADHDGGLSDVRGLPRRVRGSGRPALPRAAQRLSGVRAARCAPDRARGGARRRADDARTRSRRRRPRWRPGGSWRSRASAATTWRAARTTSGAVAELRARKRREEKPFALMVADTRAAASALALSGAPSASCCERRRAADRARPRAGRAPRRARPSRRAHADLGVMLPYTPLHHLLLRGLAPARAAAVMTSGNVSDEPIAYADEDALERLAAIADAAARPRPPDPHARRRLRRARRWSAGGRAALMLSARSRGYVPAQPAAARCAPTAAAGVRRGAEEHVLPGARGRGRGSVITSATCENWETLRSFTRGSRTSKRCSRSRPRWWPTTYTRTICRPHTRWSARAWSWWRCSITTRTWRRCWPSTASRARAWARSTTAPGYGSDGTVWGGELLVGDLDGLRARRPPAAGAAARRRRGRARAVADGVRVAARGVRRRGADPTEHGRPGGRERWQRVAALARSGSALADHHEHGAPVRRGGSAVRHPHERPRRGRRRRSSSRRRPRRERGAYPLADEAAARAGHSTPRETVRRDRGPRRRGVRRRWCRARFHNGLADATVRALAAAGGAARTSARPCSRAASSRTACCWSAAQPGSTGTACACWSPSACRRTTARSPTARRRWPRRGKGHPAAAAASLAAAACRTSRRTSHASASAGAPTLAELHRAHVTAIPFENLESPRRRAGLAGGRGPRAQARRGRRGGYCFEHNLLFDGGAAGARLRGRADARPGPLGRPARHRPAAAAICCCGSRARAASGTPTSASAPARCSSRSRSGPARSTSRRAGAFGSCRTARSWCCRSSSPTAWSDLYGFVPQPVPLVDIETSNWFTCDAPALAVRDRPADREPRARTAPARRSATGASSSW